MLVKAVFWFHPFGLVVGSTPHRGTRTRLR
jgi:hypothetical protein